MAEDSTTRKLSRKQILRGRGIFTEILSKGSVSSSGPIKLFSVRRDPNGSGPRAGFAVSRAVRNAAIRNRIKRCLREAFRLNQHLLGGTFDIVLVYTRVPRGGAGTVKKKEIEEAVVGILTRLTSNQE